MTLPLAGRPGRVLVTLSILSLTAFAPGRAEPTATAPAQPAVDFDRHIRPILSENCFACHGPDENQRKARLRFDTKDGAFGTLRRGGFAIVPGKSAESALIERITSTDPRRLMPPPTSNKHLTPQQSALLRRWIEQGARWSEHWAFIPPKRAALPTVLQTDWPRDPIDTFILARMEGKGLHPSPEADRAALIRRVTLDLTGLPPTPEEVDAFLADPSPAAYEKVVDRLLKFPRYGEHMARFWLDAARYGDTHGLHLDNYREMWPYRDWVIRAFNSNLPFDRFLTEQLAGDLLPNPTLDQIVASGFNRCHVTTSEGGSIAEECYVRNVVDRVETSGIVFVGLTVGCARCHDHKFDPIRSKEFYQLFAFFNSLDANPLDGNAARPAPVARVASPEQIATLERLDKEVARIQKAIADEVARARYNEDIDGKLKPGSVSRTSPKGRQEFETLSEWVRAQRAAGLRTLPKDIQTILKLENGKRNKAQTKKLREYFLTHAYTRSRALFAPALQQLAAAERERDELDKLIPATLVSREVNPPRPAYLLKRGEYDQKGEVVDRETPAFLPPLPPDAPRNRLGLAQWLIAPDHPLTARVAVNRFWQHCFGTGIVKTAEDFGSQGEPPSHPLLLDWLAVQFREEGWDVRKIMKRLVMSATYRQTSRVTRDRLATDPANRLLSRGPRFRLDAEMLRDQALAVSGLLVEKLGGPSVKPPQPRGLWEAVGYTSSNTAKFVSDTGAKVHRRSLYTFWKRTSPPPQMNTFDAPSRESCVVRRERTNTPLQALLLMNEKQFIECARGLAERTLRQGGDQMEDRLVFMFRLATARKPDARELALLVETYRDHLAEYSRDGESAKKLIAIGETKADEQLNPSELAAWTMVANLILNLDEVINKG